MTIVPFCLGTCQKPNNHVDRMTDTALVGGICAEAKKSMSGFEDAYVKSKSAKRSPRPG